MNAFVTAALTLEEVRKRTGLDPEALGKKVRDLEDQAAQLEARVQALNGEQEKLRDVEARRRALDSEVAELEKRREPLIRSVAEKEQREAELTRRVQELELRDQADDERLASTRRDLQMLAALGLSVEGLTGLVQRLSAVAQRRGIQPADLQQRLLRELEAMDSLLGLEGSLNERRQQLAAEEGALVEVQQEYSALEASIRQLKQAQAAVHGATTTELQRVSSDIGSISNIVREAVASLRQELKAEAARAMQEVEALRDHALAVGKELGRFDEIVASNEWVPALLALLKGDEGATASCVRVVALTVLRGVVGWLDRNGTRTLLPPYLTTNLNTAIKELEGWKP